MELPRYLKVILGFLCFVLIGNVVFLDYFFVTQRSELLDFKARLSQFSDSVKAAVERNYLSPGDTPATQTTATPSTTTTTPTTNNSCSQSCLTAIDSAITAHAAKTTTTQTTYTSPTTTTSLRGEYFINLGTGSVLNSEASASNWKTIDSAQATFDASNYPNIKSATLEVFMHVQTSGEVHARLFDSTTPAIIWNSDISANTTSSTYKSAAISLSGGSKTYKIQMYSTISTGYLDQARIHIVTQ